MLKKSKLTDDDATVRLGREQIGEKYSPVLHVLMSDGRVTEFSRRAVVIPDQITGPEDGIFAVLFNMRGEPYVDAVTGRPVVLTVPVVTLAGEPGPMTYKEVAEAAGVSLSSVKRSVTSGDLPKPQKAGLRAVRFDHNDVAEWIAKARSGRT